MIEKIVRWQIKRIGNREVSQKFLEEIQELTLLGMNIGTQPSVSSTGELNDRLINLLKQSDSNVIFDVGANIGEYSRQIHLKMDGKCEIHAFEPAAETFSRLKQNLNDTNIKVYNLGFGANNETRTLYSDEPASGMASLYRRRLDHFGVSMEHFQEVKITKLDDFCSEMNIGKIGLLKMDVEGHELEVLNGSKRMLDENRISLIQFEFGGCNIDSRTYFQDFYYLLESNYSIFRIVKDGLYPIDKYREIYEVFSTTNYLAVKKS